MKKNYFECEICGNRAETETELRKRNWLRINGQSGGGVQVWLNKPRKSGSGFMLSVGWQEREYDFCSIKCLVKALEGKESI